jgi:hypothetical protein
MSHTRNSALAASCQREKTRVAPQVRFFDLTDGKRIRHLAPSSVQPASLLLIALGGLAEPPKPEQPECIDKTLAERLGRKLMIGHLTSDMSLQKDGYHGLVNIVRKACKGLWLPGSKDARADMATHLILLWWNGKKPYEKVTDIRYIGKHARNRLIDIIRKSRTRKARRNAPPTIFIGDKVSGKESSPDAHTAEHIMEWLASLKYGGEGQGYWQFAYQPPDGWDTTGPARPA